MAVVYWRQEMPEVVPPIIDDLNDERCPRCLQPVPPKAGRCPACRQPIHSLRLLPLTIGTVGILALVFAMLLMYRTVADEDAATAPVTMEDTGQDDLLPDPPPDNRTKEPAKPEKPPPLNDR